MVVENGVGDCDSEAPMSDIQKTIVIVLVVVTVRPKFDVIDPNLRRSLNPCQ